MNLTKRPFLSYIAVLCLAFVVSFGTVSPSADDNGNGINADDNGNSVTPTPTLIVR